MTTMPGVFFIVDDDPLVMKVLSRVLAQSRECIGAADVASATARLESGHRRIAGFIIDLRLPDGTGLEFLRVARRYAPHTPAVILTGDLQPDAVNEAYRLGASCLLKPAGRVELGRFIVEALASEAGIDAVLRPRIVHAATVFGLTGPETDLLCAYLAGHSPEEIMRKRGITRNTYKTQVRTLLRRMHVDTLEAARRKLMTETV